MSAARTVGMMERKARAAGTQGTFITTSILNTISLLRCYYIAGDSLSLGSVARFINETLERILCQQQGQLLHEHCGSAQVERGHLLTTPRHLINLPLPFLHLFVQVRS
jgi:hypothetical protein